jgi:class III poly(R)-hydroxyalkanoic acid synthase PhaE subunit
MEDEQKKEPGPESMFENWLKTSQDFWDKVVGIQTGITPMDSYAKTATRSAEQADKMWRSGSKVFQLFFSIFSEPENMAAFLKGSEVVPGFMAKIAQQSWESLMEIQNHFQKHAAKFGGKTKAYDFEDLELNIFAVWKEIYEKEFRKFLNVPQLGLTRFYQERLNRFMDETNLFLTALSEFVRVFYAPIEKSLNVMQQKVEEMMAAGEIPDNFKELYIMWIKNLEGHYMTLLKSPQYTQVLNRMLQNLVKYKNARNELIADAFQNIPIPTNREMDELYKEMYHLKKRVTALENKISRQ